MLNQLVTIVIPAFNHELYIEDAVISAVTQTYRNIEVIIIDDGSTDTTTEVCYKLENEFPHLVKVITQKNMGAHNAINKGIELARGKFIAVLNSDDIFNPEKIERCINLVQQNNASQMVIGGVEFINSLGVRQTEGVSVEWYKHSIEFYKEYGISITALFMNNFAVTTSNMFFSKSLWDSNQGFMPLRYCHDLEFLVASITKQETIFDLGINHIKYRVHDKNTIKESVDKVNLEVASIIARGIIDGIDKLLNRGSRESYIAFSDLIKRKGISEIILFMIGIALQHKDKIEFYDFLNVNKDPSLDQILAGFSNE